MLPNLPIKHKKQEADMGVDFRHKFESIKHLFINAQFELKDARGEKKFYMKDLKPKQRITNKGLIRLSVATEGSADYEYHTTTPLYLVIKFKKMYIIPMERITNQVSLTEEEASQISKITI